MDPLTPIYLPDAGAVPAPATVPIDLGVYALAPAGTTETRSGHDGAAASATGAPSAGAAPPITGEEMMRSDLIQAEMAGVLALIAHDFFSRQILPAEASGAGTRKASQEARAPASGAMFNLCTLAQRHRKDFFPEARETMSQDASKAVVSPAPIEPDLPSEPPADWFVDPDLVDTPVEASGQSSADMAQPVSDDSSEPPVPAVAAENPEPVWPSNVIAFPIARRLR